MKVDYFVVNQIFGKLDSIITLLSDILKENKHMTIQMDQLVAAVNAENTVIDGAVTLITGFNAQLNAISGSLATVTAQLAAAGADTVALQAVNDAAVSLTAEIQSKTTALAAAVNNVPVA